MTNETRDVIRIGTEMDVGSIRKHVTTMSFQLETIWTILKIEKIARSVEVVTELNRRPRLKETKDRMKRGRISPQVGKVAIRETGEATS